MYVILYINIHMYNAFAKSVLVSKLEAKLLKTSTSYENVFTHNICHTHTCECDVCVSTIYNIMYMHEHVHANLNASLPYANTYVYVHVHCSCKYIDERQTSELYAHVRIYLYPTQSPL